MADHFDYLITGAGGGVGGVSRTVVELLIDDGAAVRRERGVAVQGDQPARSDRVRTDAERRGRGLALCAGAEAALGATRDHSGDGR